MSQYGTVNHLHVAECLCGVVLVMCGKKDAVVDSKQ